MMKTDSPETFTVKHYTHTQRAVADAIKASARDNKHVELHCDTFSERDEAVSLLARECDDLQVGTNLTFIGPGNVWMVEVIA